MFKTSISIFTGFCSQKRLELHMPETIEFFRNIKDQMINLRRSLTVLLTCLRVSFLYLLHVLKDSDEDVIQCWGEKPNWKYYVVGEYFENNWPYDPTQLVKFRKILRLEDVWAVVLDSTNTLAVTLKKIPKKEFCQIIVGTGDQEKIITNLTYSKLLDTARNNLVKRARLRF